MGQPPILCKLYGSVGRPSVPNTSGHGIPDPSDRLSAGLSQASVLIQGAVHTLTPEIFHQQITNFPIYRRGEMLLAVEEVGHLPW